MWTLFSYSRRAVGVHKCGHFSLYSRDLDKRKAAVVKYKYDAWGNHKVLNPDGTENTTATFIGNVNPFRYRSYYYDTNSGLYYLQTRFYDPKTGRFLNADTIDYLEPDSINGLNLYA